MFPPPHVVQTFKNILFSETESASVRLSDRRVLTYLKWTYLRDGRHDGNEVQIRIRRAIWMPNMGRMTIFGVDMMSEGEVCDIDDGARCRVSVIREEKR